MKIRILFLIVFLLTIPNIVLAEVPANQSKYWQSLTANERTYYLYGHQDGIYKNFFEMFDIISKPLDKSESYKLNQLFTEMIIDYKVIDVTVLSNVISDLYNDPANSYIEVGDMTRIARDKIQGKSVDNKLLEARRRIQHGYKSLQNLKNK